MNCLSGTCYSPLACSGFGYCREFNLTSGEKFLLDWLSKEDWSQVGECKGAELDRLIVHGFAEYGSAHPRGDDFRSVRLTDAGRAALKAQSPP